MTTIIGLAGKKGSGKSTVANILKANHGFLPTAFAEPIKRIVGDIYGLSTEQLYGELKEIIDPRYNLTPRFIMQRFGTEVARSIYPETWVEYWKRKIVEMLDYSLVVVEDLRFDNEAYAIKSLGGVIWYINRPGLKLGDVHQSENGLTITPDFIVNNVKGIKDLELEVKRGVYMYIYGFSIK